MLFLHVLLTGTLSAQENKETVKILNNLFAATRIEFMGSSMVLTKDSKLRLIKMAKQLNTYPKSKIKITGFANSRAAKSHNQSLSKNRAQQVKNILISQGVDTHLLIVKGVAGLSAKKEAARRKRTRISYIDFEVLDPKQEPKVIKSSSPNKNTNTTSEKSFNKKREMIKEKEVKDRKYKLEDYLLSGKKRVSARQEIDKVNDSIIIEKATREKEVNLKLQISKSRIHVFFSMNKVYFDQNSSLLNSDAKDVLNKTAEFMLYFPSFNYYVIGHTDKSYKEERNALLSKKRANAVKKFLVDQGGVDPSILFVLTKGSSDPIANNYSESDKALNRRVSFLIVDDK